MTAEGEGGLGGSNDNISGREINGIVLYDGGGGYGRGVGD